LTDHGSDSSDDRAETIFQMAVGLPPSERATLLGAQCGDDSTLRRHVERLLAAHDRGLDSFLETSPVSGFDTVAKQVDPERIGQYRIIRKLGEGGCGIVYLASQAHPLRREVAVKVVRVGLNTRQVVARFNAERQVLAMMDHPGIATVYDAGVAEDGRPYFVMERVDGIPLMAYCRQFGLDERARLRLFISVCQAIEHAHRRGIIHRDIKPSNILVTEVDGRPHPKVIDFGVSKAMGASATEITLVTETGQLMGTPQYMSPEQCAGRPGEIDTRSDVYSLGVVLYELLTGELPYDLTDSHFYEIPRIVREMDARRPSSINRRVRGDLETILLTALDKDRERRYDSVGALSADLENYLGNRPIQAKRDSSWYVIRKTASRHRGKVAVLLAFAALVTGSAVALGILYVRSERNRELANLRKDAAEASAREALRQSYQAGIHAAYRAFAASDIPAAWHALDATPEVFRDWEWYYLRGQVDQSVLVLAGHEAAVADVSWSPDGSRLVSGSLDKTVRFWSVADRRCVRVRNDHEDMVFTVAYSPDGSMVASGSRDHTVRLWDAATGVPLRTLQHDERVSAIAFSPDGRFLAATLPYARKTILWDVAAARVVATFERPDHHTHCVAFTPDGRWLAVGSTVDALDVKEADVRIYDIETGKTVRVIGADATRVADLAIDPTGRYLAAALTGTSSKIWAIHDNTPPVALSGVEGDVNSTQYTPDGMYVVGGAADSLLHVWNAEDGRLVRTYRGHRQAVGHVRISPDGKRVASVSPDATIRVWDLTAEQRAVKFRAHELGVVSIAISPDGHRLATGSQDQTIGVWDVATATRIRSLRGHTKPVYGLTFGSSSIELVSGALDGSVRFWDLASGTQQKQLSMGLVRFMAGTHDGTRIAVSSEDGVLSILDATTRQLFAQHDGGGRYSSIAFDPEGTHLAQVCMDGRVRIYAAPRFEQIRSFSVWNAGRSHLPHGASYSPDGRHLAICSTSGAVVVVSAEDGSEVCSHGSVGDAPVRCAAFNSTGTRLAVGSDDGLSLLDAETCEVVLFFHDVTQVESVAFCPDDSCLVAGDQNGDLLIYRSTSAPRSTKPLQVEESGTTD